MGKREKKSKAAKAEEISSSDKEKRTPIEEVNTDDDEEANEDLSLKIVQKAKLRSFDSDPLKDGVYEIVTNLKDEKRKKEKKEKRKKKKGKETEAPEEAGSSETGDGFKNFCGELFLEDNGNGDKKLETEKATEIAHKVVEMNPVEMSDNAVLRKLLRGPRYFDPPDNSWGTCYNCGEEGHTTVNCVSAKRKKPCFVCGSLEHNAKQCSKAHGCFICKQQGHRAKDCPEKNRLDARSSKTCLKCGESGHDMFSCRNDYSPGDLKEMQCYVCQNFGHLCCVNYNDPRPREMSCYRCGLLGHTGLACAVSKGDTAVARSVSSCFRCGEEGHFARECTSSIKAGKRNREPSTPKQRSSKNDGDHREARSVPYDLGKMYKKKKTQYEGRTMSASKEKHRGGWITEDPRDCLSYKSKASNWRSPATPSNKRSELYSSTSDFTSSSSYSKRPHKLCFSNSASNGSTRFYEHRFSASRFGNNSYDGMRRNYDWW